MYRPKKCMSCGGKMQTGGSYTSQSQIDAANAFAKEFAKRKGTMNPQEAYVARKIGDPVAQFLGEDGKPFVMRGIPTKRVHSLPRGVNLEDIHSEQGLYWYNDPTSGDLVDVDPSVVSKFRGNNALAKFQIGGTSGPQFGAPAPTANMWDLNYQNIQRPKLEGEDHYKIDQDFQKKGTPNSFDVVAPKRGMSMDPGVLSRAATLALSEISGRVERGRQNQYMYNQLSTMGQMNPMQVQDFQPNYYNLYMKYGGKVKSIYRDGGKKFSNNTQFKMDTY